MKISCIIPSYNRYELLKKAIHSVLNSSFPPNEIIIIDDGSCDNTKNIQNDYKSIRYFYIENTGVSKARNLGIQKAKYEWICFLDSDDIWQKDKLQNQINFHKQNKTILISQCNEIWIRNSNQVIIPQRYKKYQGDIFKQAIKNTIVSMSSLMLHKSIFHDIGYFDENLIVCEDYDLSLRIARKYQFGLIQSEDIIKYGGNKDQLSLKYFAMDKYRIIALMKHLDKHIFLDEVKLEINNKLDIWHKGAMKNTNYKLIDFCKKIKETLG